MGLIKPDRVNPHLLHQLTVYKPGFIGV